METMTRGAPPFGAFPSGTPFLAPFPSPGPSCFGQGTWNVLKASDQQRDHNIPVNKRRH